MKIDSRIRENIQEIRDYTVANSELRERSHHFLYDKRYTNSETITYIVMGINPGEPKNEKNLRGVNAPLEETSEYDFLKNGIETTSAKKWRNNCQEICGTLDIALTEAIFWSSLDIQELEQRYGTFQKSPHIEFCAKMNRDLIEIHNPRAVLFVGIRFRDQIARIFRLEENGEPVRSSKVLKNGSSRTDTIIAPYRDPSHRPWIFFKHWSSRLRKEEKRMMSEFLANAVAGRGH